MLAGGKYATGYSTYYLYTNKDWWSGSPSGFIGHKAREIAVGNAGHPAYSTVNLASGVRPAVSLKPGTKFSGGDGSYTDPYVAE